MTVTVRGVVTSGLGKGREFIALNGYAEQFEEKLGYEPYPGTLNLALEESIEDRLASLDPIRISGWESGETTFGAVDCYPATPLEDPSVQLHLLVPDRTDHDLSTLELISPIQLRDRFSIADGDSFEIRIEPTDTPCEP